MFQDNDSFLSRLQTNDAVAPLVFAASVPTNNAADSEAEGQLSVDVLETPEEIIVVAAMAGTRPEDIQLHLAGDVFTVRGVRHSPVAGGESYFYKECFWGRFSRTIVLPTEVKSEQTNAEYKNGVLTVRLPKARHTGSIPILVVEE